jgi:hypothetical protein
MSSPPWGHVAEWLRNGLQNRLHQFNSGRGLQPSGAFPNNGLGRILEVSQQVLPAASGCSRGRSRARPQAAPRECHIGSHCGAVCLSQIGPPGAE